MRRLGAAWAISLTFTGCSGRDAAVPAEYARLSVPQERLHSVEARERGRLLFRQHCALCHGEKADGRGVRHEGLSTRPRDFTDPGWRLRATPLAVYAAIREGVRGTAMPSWKALDASETWDLVAFLLAVDKSNGAAKEGRGPAAAPEKSAR